MRIENVTDEPMTPERMVNLVKHFYTMGYMRDQGGGIAVRVPEKKQIYCSPTQVQKEDWDEKDLIIVNEEDGSFVQRPQLENKTSSSPLGLIKATGANCVVHTHSKYAVLITKLIRGNEFSIQDQEMLVGIHNRNNGMQNFLNTDTITVPIIEALPNEDMLRGPTLEALARYPETSAVLVRGHGVFCFGFGITWQRTKMMLECYEYLFEMGCMMINSGVPLTTTARRMSLQQQQQQQQQQEQEQENSKKTVVELNGLEKKVVQQLAQLCSE